jgi:sigma-B regulation protein RsbU (phosphoserine phosphatase)
MRIELANSLDEMANVIMALEEFSDSAGLDMRAAQAAEMALDELLTNIISYGYLDSGQHKITVDMCVEENALQIVVSDGGTPFNPFEQAEPDVGASIDERELGGLGIHLVKKFMDECSNQRLDERNVVTLRKYIDEN